jgi:cob(I)alamin adenosyltransferase
VRLDRIYTRGGDAGQTSLGDGDRIAKHHVRVRAMGDVDEANSVIGVALLHIQDEELRAFLSRVQNDLFDLGADLCRPEKEGDDKARLRISAKQVAELEARIDHYNADLAPLTSFILPGGSPAASHIHLARAVARRAERTMTELAASEPVNAEACKYVNRLSDLFFVLARYLNARGTTDVLWQPGQNR